jgi:uncharacterized membrane protein YjfL (UPF0719 family)
VRMPMGVDEVWVSIIGTLLSAFIWIRWYLATAGMWPSRGRPIVRGPLWIAPLLAAALIMATLRLGASFDVVDDARYRYMYFALGMAWVGAATFAFPTTGLFLRDDAVERRNPAVAPALAGAVIGVAAAYAGGNIGDGPGWPVVVQSAFVGTLALLLAWHLHDALSGIGDAITIERDVAAGWRLGGFLAASGVVLGRAVAGDWVSSSAMLRDAVTGSWPILGLLAFAHGCARGMRLTVAAPKPAVASRGIMPAVVMILAAIGWLAWRGAPV